jgi:predicted nucleic acid-binding protein
VILVDGTAWIEYLHATGSQVDARVGELLAGNEPIGVTDLVLMKVLAGARDDAHRDRLRRLLARCARLTVDAPADYERAADLHRRCRDAGVRIRHLPECLIAVVAMRHGASVLHSDPDFDTLAGCSPLVIDPVAPAGA